MTYCTNCGKPVDTPGIRYCPFCGNQIPSIEEPDVRSVQISGIPFEDRQPLGFWRSYFQTWKLASLEPAKFYPAVGKSKDVTSSLLFFIATTVISVLIDAILHLSFTALLFPLLPFIRHGNADVPSLPPAGLGILFVLIFGVLIVPFISFLILLFFAAITHLFLWLLRGAKGGFSTTLGTFGYASAPNLIPVIGWIWSSILVLFGLAHAHGVEVWRSFVALTLEFLFFIFLLLIPIVFFLVPFLNRVFRGFTPTL